MYFKSLYHSRDYFKTKTNLNPKHLRINSLNIVLQACHVLESDSISRNCPFQAYFDQNWGGGGGGGPTILKYIKVYPRVKIGKNPTF